MAEEHQNKSHEYETSTGDEVETKDRGLFDFLSKKKEEEKKPQEEVLVAEFEQVHVSEPEPCKIEEDQPKKEEDKKPSLLEKLHRSDSSSSSSSDEEEGEGKEKKKKKKGLKEKIKKEEKCEDTTVPIERYEEHPTVVAVPAEPEEKKGFLDKIKEKLPGQHKKTEETPLSPPPPPPPPAECAAVEEGEPKEKKGLLEKIKEKLPGYHPKSSTSEEDKEKEKD